MKWVRQRLGWHGSDFQLDMRAEGGTLVLRGVRQDAHDTSTNLPPGFYNLRVQVEEAVVRKQAAGVQLKSEGYHEATVDLATDDRTITVDLVGCDAEVERMRITARVGRRRKFTSSCWTRFRQGTQTSSARRASSASGARRALPCRS